MCGAGGSGRLDLQAVGMLGLCSAAGGSGAGPSGGNQEDLEKWPPRPSFWACLVLK